MVNCSQERLYETKPIWQRGRRSAVPGEVAGMASRGLIVSDKANSRHRRVRRGLGDGAVGRLRQTNPMCDRRSLERRMFMDTS
jgi:hypothetical protein